MKGQLEEILDAEVSNYLDRLENLDEVKCLTTGKIDKYTYVRFLKTFYIIEMISQKAVRLASKNTKGINEYLSKRFLVCAKGEVGHAEIALEDLKEMGQEHLYINEVESAEVYNEFLQRTANEFPLGILGHSYLFENASGILFPKNEKLGYPSKFIEVHAKEDPGHSLAIKRTVRNIEEDLSDQEIGRIISLSRQSGEHFMKVFDSF